MYRLFEADTLKDLMLNVKKELGPNAVILKPREVSTGGLGGLMGHKKWRVFAYLPAGESAAPATQSPAQVRGPSTSRPHGAPSRTRVQQPVNHIIDEPALPFGDERIAEPKPKLPAPSKWAAPSKLSKPASVRTADEIVRARPAVSPVAPPPSDIMTDPAFRTLLKEVRALSEQLTAISSAPKQAQSEHVILPGVLQPFYQQLQMQEVPRDLCLELMDALCDRPTLDIHDGQKVAEQLEELLASQIQTSALDPLFTSRRPRIVFFVGPAGAGKTTTLAKVATLASRDEKLKIAFVTVDTMRVAAAEQLKTYADLISASIEVVMSESDFAAAVVRHADKDLILVDTPGKDPCSPASLAEFSAYLKQLGGMRLPAPAVLPVLAAPTRLSDLDRYANCYQALQPAGLVFTKLDETRTYGSMLSVMRASKLPAIFFSTGQEVPDHIEPAGARRLARRILGCA